MNVFYKKPCYGPHNISTDFFKLHDECNGGYGYEGLGAIGIVIGILILLLLLFVCYIIYLRSRQITFWVNRRRTAKENTTYEALNGQVDTTTKESEAKVLIKRAINFVYHKDLI